MVLKEVVNVIDLKGKILLMILCFLKVSWWLINNGKKWERLGIDYMYKGLF